MCEVAPVERREREGGEATAHGSATAWAVAWGLRSGEDVLAGREEEECIPGRINECIKALIGWVSTWMPRAVPGMKASTVVV